MTKAVIVDIDGTLADLSHRLHHIKRPPMDWDAFFAECVDDAPIQPIIDLVHLFEGREHRIILVSGRSDQCRQETEGWLDRHGVPFHELHMRKAGDYRQDFIVKSEILDELLAAGNEIAFVVDDRPSVVAMWRSRGLTCLQCRDWDEDAPSEKKGLLTLMVGPSCAGKSFWLQTDEARNNYGIHSSHVVSSDQIRSDLCGDFRDQTRNDEVFAALHAVVKARISHGLPTVVDATNLKRADRTALFKQMPAATQIRYIVIDRPMVDKRRDGGWRLEVPGMLEKHQQRFNSALRDILAGDGLPNAKVHDLRISSITRAA